MQHKVSRVSTEVCAVNYALDVVYRGAQPADRQIRKEGGGRQRDRCENYFDLQKTGSVNPSAPMRAHLLCSLLALPAAAALLVAPTAARLPRVAASRAAGPAMIFGDIMKGVAKLQAGSYDEAAVKAALERQIQNRPCV
eukprot:scaffold18932_cov65-Phaeocystis_antarctica.AAC.1